MLTLINDLTADADLIERWLADHHIFAIREEEHLIEGHLLAHFALQFLYL